MKLNAGCSAFLERLSNPPPGESGYSVSFWLMYRLIQVNPFRI